MESNIVEYGSLNENQKWQAVELFMEGFGHMMTFSKNYTAKKQLFFEIFHSSLFRCYLEDDSVLGMIGVATNEVRPINFKRDSCVKHFGKIKGRIISKQMNGIFQKPVVKNKNELYVDVLVVRKNARKKGIGTKLLNNVFEMDDYNEFSIEVFSKNIAALNLYKKVGFKIKKNKKFSFMRILGQGYPIQMVKKAI